MVGISQSIIEDSIHVLERAIRAINTKSLLDLESISNETIHNSTISQDDISTNISKLLYGIFKLERHSILKGIPLPLEHLADLLIKLHDIIGLGKINDFNEEIKKTFHEIEKIGKEVRLSNVIDRAAVKKGSKVYEHGLSAGKAAETMKISQWEIYPYIGRVKSNDYPEDLDKNVKKRMMYSRGLFS